MASSAEGFPERFGEGAETCTRGRVRSPIHELVTRTSRSGRADCSSDFLVSLCHPDLAPSDELRREFCHNGNCAGFEERVAAGKSARTWGRVGETASAAPMDIWRPFGVICSGETFHRRQWFAGDIAND